MSPARFEPAVPASERPQAHALDGAATGTGLIILGDEYDHEAGRSAQV
jgi:hypothetical protein